MIDPGSCDPFTMKCLALYPKCFVRSQDKYVDGPANSLSTSLKAHGINGGPYGEDREVDCILQSEETPRNWKAWKYRLHVACGIYLGDIVDDPGQYVDLPAPDHPLVAGIVRAVRSASRQAHSPNVLLASVVHGLVPGNIEICLRNWIQLPKVLKQLTG